MKNNIWQSILGVLIGGVLLYLTLQNKPLGIIAENIKSAKLLWVISNGLLLLWVFWLRAMRWKLLLENNGHFPKRKDIFYAVTLAYFINGFTPKFGEIARCTSLKKTSQIPLPVSFGTVVSERIWDLIVLFGGLIILFFLEIKRLGNILSSIWEYLYLLISSNFLLATIAVFLLLGIIFIIWKVFKNQNIIKKATVFVIEISSTIKKTFQLKKAKTFIFQTVLIWTALILMNYSCLKALPNTENLGLYFAVIVLFIGGLGWAIPTPGGIGTTHFVILQLFLAFELTENAGISFGILSNGLTFVYTILLGAITFIIYNTIKVFSINKNISITDNKN